MQDEDWDEEEPIYPRAPLPPHERVWRHPSELGFVAQPRHLPPPPRIPRVLLVGAGAVAVAAAAGIVLLLAPRSGTTVIQTASQPASTVIDRETDDSPTTASVAEPVTTAKRRRTTTTQRQQPSVSVLSGAHSMSTMSISGAARVAVAVGDGRHALTTADSLSIDQIVEVEVGDGSVVAARVLNVSTEYNIAVLELERVMTKVARQVTYATPTNGDRVLVGQDAIEAIVHVTERGLRVDTDALAQNGEPVMSGDGKLVGLISRSGDGSLRLATIPRLAALKATIVVIDVWLGLRFESDSLHVIEANAEAPAALAGIEPGDALTAINDSVLTCIDDLWVELAFMKAGQTVTLEFLRNGVAHAVDVTLAARPS